MSYTVSTEEQEKVLTKNLINESICCIGDVTTKLYTLVRVGGSGGIQYNKYKKIFMALFALQAWLDMDLDISFYKRESLRSKLFDLCNCNCSGDSYSSTFEHSLPESRSNRYYIERK